MKTIDKVSAVKFLLLPGVILASSVFATQEVKASTLVIDNFNTTPVQTTLFSSIVPPDNSVPPETLSGGNSFPPGDVIGGFREFEHFLFQNDGGNVLPANSTIGGVNANLLLQNAPDANSTLTLTYDANDLGLGLDLLTAGFDEFSIEIVDVDLPANLEILLEDSLGNVSTVSEIVDPSDIGESILLPFINLEPTDVTAADLSDIDSISLIISSDDPALDLVIDNFTVEGGDAAVPEPTTVLGLVTLAGFFLTSKRKKSAN